MKMHTSIFYKNHHKYLSPEEFYFLVELYIFTYSDTYTVAMTSKNKRIIKSLKSKGYIEENTVIEIKSDIRFFEIDEEEFLELAEKLSELEIYTYYLIESLFSQSESVTNEVVARQLDVDIRAADYLINKLIREQHLIEK